MTREGFIKLWRSEVDALSFGPEKFCKRMAWVDLRVQCSWRDETIYRHERMVRLKEGQLVTTYTELASRWDWGRPKVKKFIEELAKGERLDIQPVNKGLILTLYGDHRFEREDGEEFLGSKAPRNSQHEQRGEQEIERENEQENEHSLYYREEVRSKKITPKPPFEGGLSNRQKKKFRVKENSPMMIKIGKCFHMKPHRLWTVSDAELLDEIGDVNDYDLERLLKYYTHDEMNQRPLRRTLSALLENWDNEVARARDWCDQNWELFAIPSDSVEHEDPYLPPDRY